MQEIHYDLIAVVSKLWILYSSFMESFAILHKCYAILPKKTRAKTLQGADYKKAFRFSLIFFDPQQYWKCHMEKNQRDETQKAC